MLLSFSALILTITANPIIHREGDPQKCICQVIMNNYGFERNCSSNKKLLEENAQMKKTIWELQMEIEALKAIPDAPISDKYEVITVDGARWRAFWWYEKGSGWPSGKNDVLGDKYGSCDPSAPYCFSRLPEQLPERGAEMLGKDSAGNIYRWTFDAGNPTAHAVWLAFHDHKQTAAGSIKNNRNWNPKVVAGKPAGAPQDSFMYRPQHGVVSVLIDDDNCDCYSSLSLGHGMCSTSYDENFGSAYSFGVDLLYDSYCNAPSPNNGLTLYFRDENDCLGVECEPRQICVDGINTATCIG